MLLWGRTAAGQDIIFNVVPLTEAENNDHVTGITQDVNGLMWFATKVGLLSYDGNNVNSYKNNPINPNSLVSNFAESIFADTNGNIWIGTLGYGLDLFDPGTGIFTHFRHDPQDPGSISNDTVTEILRDRQGVLWIGTHGGLDRYDPETGQFIHFRSSADDSTSLSFNQVRALYEDRQGILWVGTGSPYLDNGGGPDAGGLNRMDRTKGTFTRYMHDPGNSKSLVSNKISAIYEDDKGVLWIGTSRYGLHRMNKQQGTFDRLLYDPEHPNAFAGPEITSNTLDYDHITFITQDIAGNFWLGTVENGIHYFNPKHGKMMHFRRQNNPNQEMQSNGVWSAYSSRDGMLWIGGINRGFVYRINTSPQKIPFFATSAGANSFYETTGGSLWIATNNKLIKKEKTGQTIIQHEVDLTPNDEADDGVQIILEDKQGNVWIGGSGGLGLWDAERSDFRFYRHDPGERNSLSNNNVITIYEDNESNLWVGTIDGLNLLDREKGTFKKYYLNKTDTAFIGRNIVTAVVQDHRGEYWVSTWNGSGVYRGNPASNTSKVYLTGVNIVCLFEDASNRLWLGSTYGLYYYDPETDNFARYIDPFAMRGITSVNSIREDNQRYLWISTNDGLARINPRRNETNLLDKAYGLETINLLWNSSHKGRDGTLYFGGESGYVVFDPATVITNKRPPEVVLTGFRLADQVMKPGNGSPLDESLASAEEIRLEYSQNVFSFDYAIIDFVNPEENQLTYFLENYDNNWLPANAERRAYYFNVPPGKYTFRIKGANSYGIWAEKKINLTILPPWWKSYWAYGLYGLLFILLVFGFDRFQRRRIHQIERQKAHRRELAQAKEIEKAYTKLKATQTQLIHSEKMASLGELTAGIAHEIQNPLNFVNNFSDINAELIDELQDELRNGKVDEAILISNDIKENEQKISSHGKRAESIVKGMLLHSRGASGQKEKTDINLLADEYLRLSYHGFRARDKSFNAEFKLEADETLPKVRVVPQDIGRVILNLVNNAFFATTEKKEQTDGAYMPTVTVMTKNAGDHIQIRVKDNGNGIPDNVLDKIFQPFFTTKPTGVGTGLGLSLSYDIITKGHGGELMVESKENEGSTFTITLPLTDNTN